MIAKFIGEPGEGGGYGGGYEGGYGGGQGVGHYQKPDGSDSFDSFDSSEGPRVQFVLDDSYVLQI